VLGADDVDTLVFDVLGTAVDEPGSMRAELAAALDQAGDGPREAEALAVAWAWRPHTASRLSPPQAAVRQSGPGQAPAQALARHA
jgi:phosphoglycolate phosphatase-like HAD superfamily hydrolase